MRSIRWWCAAALVISACCAAVASAQEPIPWRIDSGTPITPEIAGGGETWSLVGIPGLPAGSVLGEVKVGPDGTVYVWTHYDLLVPPGSSVGLGQMSGTELEPIGWEVPSGDPTKPDVGGAPPPRSIVVSALYRFNGIKWQPILQRGGEIDGAIYLAPSGQVFASTNTVFGEARVYRLAGSRWSIDQVPWTVRGKVGDIVGVAPMGGAAALSSEPIGWRVPSGDPWTPEEGGDYSVFTRIGTTVLRHFGNRWIPVYSNPVLDTGGGEVIALDDRNVLVPYDGGQMHYDGSTWHSHPAACARHFHCGWGARDAEGVFHMYSTGCDDAHRHATVWKFVESPARDLTGTMELAFEPTAADEPPSYGSKVCGIALDDVYIVGRHGGDGFVYHFDGHAWQDLALMPNMPPASSVAGNPAGDVWVTLGDGRLLHRPADRPTGFRKAAYFLPDPPLEEVLPAAVRLQVRSEGNGAEVEFGLPVESQVTVAVFDLAGRCVGTVERGCLPAGTHRRTWDAAGAPSGIYFLRIDAGSWRMTRKVAIQR